MVRRQYANTSDRGLYVVVIIVITDALPSKYVAEWRYCHILMTVTLALKACSFQRTPLEDTGYEPAIEPPVPEHYRRSQCGR